MTKRGLVLLAIGVLAAALAAVAVGYLARKHASPKPVVVTSAPLTKLDTPRVYVGVYLRDISALSVSDATFNVDAEVWAKWRGEVDPSELRVANASSDVTFEEVKAESDGDWHVKSWRLRGPLRAEFPLQIYPFDRQEISIDFELRARAGALSPDLAASSIAERFSVTGWDYTPKFTVTTTERRYASDFGRLDAEGTDTTTRLVSFRLPVSRPSLMAALKLFIPILIILLVALVALWVHPEELEARAGIGVTALLTCFAFQFAVADSLPQVSYLTLTDRVFIAVYTICIVVLIMSVFVAWLCRKEHVEWALRIDRISRLAFPVMIAALAVTTDRAPPPVQVEAAQPVSVTVPASSRPVLRVATTRDSMAAAIAGRLYDGDLTLDDRDRLDDSMAIYVERVPTVTTRDIELLPHGQLEVRWTLRADVKWSDGTPLQPSDICYAEKLRKRPNLLECTVDGRTAVLRFDDRVVFALSPPNVMPQAEIAKRKLTTYDEIKADTKKRPLPGLGPYRPKAFDPTTKIVLEKNPFYPGPKPSIETIEIITAKNVEEVRALIEQKAIDITAPNTLDPPTYLALASTPGVGLHEGGLLVSLVPDYSVPLLASLEGRRAIAAALDRVGYARGIYQGLAKPADALVKTAPGPGRDIGPIAAILAAHPDWKTKIPIYGTADGPQIQNPIAEDLKSAGLDVEVRAEKDLVELRKTKHGGLIVLPQLVGPNASPLVIWNLPTRDGFLDRKARHVGFTEAIAAQYEIWLRSMYLERRDQIRAKLDALHATTLPTIPVAWVSERMYVDPALRDWDGVRSFGYYLPRAYFAP